MVTLNGGVPARVWAGRTAGVVYEDPVLYEDPS